jgi:tRNA G10  N-methylase Trm11
LPFLVPPESIDSESLILVTGFGMLSLLEAQCVLGESALISMQCEDIAVADLKNDDGNSSSSSSASVMRYLKGFTQLAGVHKIAVPLPPIESTDFAEAITFPDKNFNFSLSLYCPESSPDTEYEVLAEELLSALREAGHRKANLIRSRSGPELYSEKVLSRSAMDFVVFPMRAALQWGVTVYVPETEGFRKRSMERPYVSSGISLSSRLARLLVNIAGAREGHLLLDPFCGSGTILAEALLKGADCIGIDRNHGRVEQTKKNLAWVLSRGYRRDSGGGGAASLPRPHAAIPRTTSSSIPSYSVVAGDATRLRRALGDIVVDAVVSEPILIPRLSSAPSIEKARRLVRHVSATYSEALHEMTAVLRPGGRIVLVAPSIDTIDGREVTLTLEGLEDIGLRPLQPSGPARYQYPLRISHQSTRWIKRMVYALERT